MKSKTIILALTAIIAFAGCKSKSFSFGIAVPEGVSMETVTYAIKGGDTLRFDILRDTTASQPRPTFIYSFGGGWRKGDRSAPIWGGRVVKQGYNFVTIDYRKAITDKSTLTDSATFAQNYDSAMKIAIEDLFDATSYLVEHAQELGVRPDRIVASGGSAGAINSVTGEWLICNGDPLAQEHLPAGFNYAGIVAFAGAVWKPGIDEELEYATRPCPHMFVHGTCDQAVAYDRMKIVQSDYTGYGPAYLSELFRKNGWAYELFTVEDSDHLQFMGPDLKMFFPASKLDYTRHMFDFLERFVDQQQPLQIEYREKDLDGARTQKGLMKKYSNIFKKMKYAREVGELPQFGSGELKKETFDFAVKDGDTLRVDIFSDPSFQGPRPAFIYSFGGGWEGGNRFYIENTVFPFAIEMARMGFVVASYDYRLGYKMAKDRGDVPDIPVDQYLMHGSSDVKAYNILMDAVEMALEDLYDVTSFVVDNAGRLNIDPSKVMVGGGSAGAFNSLMAEYRICNDDPIALARLPKGFNYAGVVPCAGAIWHPMDEELNWKKMPCPILFLHGNSDRVVAYERFEAPEAGLVASGPAEIVPGLEKMGASYMFYTGEKRDHEMAGIPTGYMNQFIVAFIDRLVLNGEKVQAEISERWEPDPVNPLPYYLQRSQRYPWNQVTYDYVTYIANLWN